MALLTSLGNPLPVFKYRPTQFQQGQTTSLPAPYGGLNLRDDITALQPNEARVLENWYPSSGQLSLRSGNTSFATGMGSGEVKTLASFVGYTTSKMIAGANGKLWDATVSGAATQLATGFTEDRWQTALYSNTLQLVNGTDAPQVYTGGTASTIGWNGSGLTNTNLVNVALVRNRLWFCENGQADVWYANIGQITGGSALTKFQLSQIAGGGFCMAIGAWTVDGGAGADDLTVFVMSTGELIVYQGDPATTFSLIGKYPGSPPVGRQCLFKVGGELVVITSLGMLPISAAGTTMAASYEGESIDLGRINPWGKVAPGIAADVFLDGNNPGWHVCVHEGIVVLNVPQTTGSLSKQYVLNTRNSAWTVFTGYNGSSFCTFQGSLYFGAQTGGTTYQVTGSSDNGSNITAVANGAFVHPEQSFNNNLFTLSRPVMQASGSVSGLIGVDTNYIIASLSGQSVPIVASQSVTPWGSAWGSPWGVAGNAQNVWYSIQGLGRSVSVKLSATGQSADLRWFSTDLIFKPGSMR